MRRSHNKVPKLHVSKGDTVKVLSGSADIRGKQGEIKVIDPIKKTAIVGGLNIITRHIKGSQDAPNGSIQKVEAPIHISKLQVICPKTKKPTRIGRVKTENGWKRVAKVSGEIIHPVERKTR